MSTARRVHYSYEDYVHALEMSDVKLEYCDGEIYAIAGGTPAHAELAIAAGSVLRGALRGRCRVFSSDLKVRIEKTDLSTFPDVTVVCGELQFSPIDRNAVVNPSLLVEVTSDSTEDYDRGNKLGHYQQLESLRAAIFVSHRRPQITVHRRVENGWEIVERRPGERIELPDPALSFAVDEIYAGIALDTAR